MVWVFGSFRNGRARIKTNFPYNGSSQNVPLSLGNPRTGFEEHWFRERVLLGSVFIENVAAPPHRMP